MCFIFLILSICLNIYFAFLKKGCNVGFHGENCTKCPVNCLNDTCQVQTGYCFDCKDGFKGEMCDEGIKFQVRLMLKYT